MRAPSNSMVPALGLMSPETVLKMVLFPEPFGPSKLTTSPALTWRDTPQTTW